MAPPAYVRVQMEGKIGGNGFSEDYYIPGGTPSGSQAAAQALVDARLPMLVTQGRIHHVRISPVVPGARSFRFVPTSTQGTDIRLRDEPNGTMTIGAYDSVGRGRVLKFHGVADAQTSYNASGDPVNAIPGSLSNFLSALKAAGGAIRELAVTAGAARTGGGSVISAISVVGNTITFTTAFPMPTAPFKVLVRSCRGFHARDFNGIWTIGGAIAGPPAQLTAGVTRAIQPAAYYAPNTGYMVTADPTAGYTFAPIVSFDGTVNFSSRKTGRPTDAPRGRVSSR